MHIPRKPAESLEVDWSGDTLDIYDPSGKKITAHIFVAVLSYSQLTYAEAFPDESINSWIIAHIHVFEFFSGVPREIIPDNCKTAVIKNTNNDIILNTTYREMSEHYCTIIMPARVRTPKDKPNVEFGVNCVQRSIIAPIRNNKFFSLNELNQSIRNSLDSFNNKPFQKKDGSRRSVFENEEREFLLPLPATRFELSIWKSAKVQYNYHIFVDHIMYSVPFEYIGKQVDVKITNTMIEVYFNNARIASHQRSYNQKQKYVTNEAHMPINHKMMAKWDGAAFREWALKIGTATHGVVDKLLRSAKVEQQAYRSCMAVLNLSKKYSDSLLELACKNVISFGNVSLKAVQKSIKALVTNANHTTRQQDSDDGNVNPHGITRGPNYFDRSNS